MMLPMSVRCNTCGNFMYKGTKFNCRMEDVQGENYLVRKGAKFVLIGGGGFDVPGSEVGP